MCLYNPIEIHPSQDIKAYKVLLRTKTKEKEHLWSPIYEYEWRIGIRETVSFGFSPIINTRGWLSNTGVNTIIEGNCFHTFTSYEQADNYRRRMLPNDMVVAECTIPANSRVYIGRFDIEKDSYASTSLIINKILL